MVSMGGADVSMVLNIVMVQRRYVASIDALIKTCRVKLETLDGIVKRWNRRTTNRMFISAR